MLPTPSLLPKSRFNSCVLGPAPADQPYCSRCRWSGWPQPGIGRDGTEGKGRSSLTSLRPGHPSPGEGGTHPASRCSQNAATQEAIWAGEDRTQHWLLCFQTHALKMRLKPRAQRIQIALLNFLLKNVPWDSWLRSFTGNLQNATCCVNNASSFPLSSPSPFPFLHFPISPEETNL